MKILLINPNRFAHRYASIGISMISAMLKRAGHQVSYFDTSRFSGRTGKNEVDYFERSMHKMEAALQFRPVIMPPIRRSGEKVVDALHSRIKSFNPGLVGFSATSSDFPYAINLVKEIKKYRIPVIIGGIHATVAPMDVLKVDGFDMVLVGEGEEAIVELAASMESGRHQTDIKNIYFKDNKRIIKNGIRPYNKDLDSLPFMDLDIFDTYHHLGAYQGRLATYARVEAGRGCPYRCAYCVNGELHDAIYRHEKKHVRYKSPLRIIEELEFINTKINYTIVRFVDETFTACSAEWLEEFVGLYKNRINKPMIVATRPDSVTRGKMEILRQAHGSIQVTMGIESGSEKIRREVLNRNISNTKIVKAYNLCHELGFFTASFNMIGLPGETRKEFFETIELNAESNVQVPMLSYFYPFTGSKLRDICIERRYMSDKLHEVDYSVASVLKLPGFSHQEMEGLKRTFVMYVKMGKSFYGEIKRAEQDDEIFHELSEEYKKGLYGTKII